MTFDEYLTSSAIEMDRQGFAPIAFVRDVPEHQFQGALAFLYCFGLRGRWDIEMNDDAGTYDFMFEDEDDAASFRVFL